MLIKSLRIFDGRIHLLHMHNWLLQACEQRTVVEQGGHAQVCRQRQLLAMFRYFRVGALFVATPNSERHHRGRAAKG
jgi:hypothetical protein